MVFPDIFYVGLFVVLEAIILAAVRDSWLKFTSLWMNPFISALFKKSSFFGIDSFWYFKLNCFPVQKVLFV